MSAAKITAMVLFVAIGVAGARAHAAETTRFAVVVGNNIGLPRSEPLKFAEKDARRFADVLVELGGVRPENVTVLAGRKPQDLRSTLEAVSRRIHEAGGKTVLFFYYSGHADSGWIRMGGKGMRLLELRRRLQMLPADVRVAIVDSCQAGEITRAKGGKVVSPFADEDQMNASGLVIITSASAHENAQESDVLESSFFNHHLVSGLRGAADKSEDGRVSVAEAYHYVYRHTVRETEGTVAGVQHPTFFYALSGEGDVMLTSVLERGARLALPVETGGVFLILGASGQIEAEVFKGEGEPLTIALAPGEYQVKRRAENLLWTATVRIDGGKTLGLDPSHFEKRDLSEGRLMGPAPAPGQASSPFLDQQGRHLQPRPLSDMPLGGTGRNGTAGPVAAPLASSGGPQTASPAGGGLSGSAAGEGNQKELPSQSKEQNVWKKMIQRREGAVLWPPLALGISMLGPGVPQMVDRRFKAGGVILGTFVGSVVAASLLGIASRDIDSDAGKSGALMGASIAATYGFFTYSFSAVDAFYSHTPDGPGTPRLEDWRWDMGLSLAPGLSHALGGDRVLAVGGGLGVGFAVHPNLVLGIRNLAVNNFDEIVALQLAPELRLRFQIAKKLAWSVGAGATLQMQFENEDIESSGPEWESGDAIDRFDGAYYPYLAAQLHYFPAARWSLDLGVRGGYTIGKKRFFGGVVVDDGTLGAEYIAGLTYYR